jgi:cytochrome c peroxidase
VSDRQLTSWKLSYTFSLSAAVLYLISVGGAVSTYFLARRNFKPTKEDYQNVYNEIASRLGENCSYDDGSYGPILVRLAWHASGTYSAETGTGGSNGATMRFCPESEHSANAGLNIAQNFLKPVKSELQTFIQKT